MTVEFDDWKAEQAGAWLRHIRDLKRDIVRLEGDIETQRSLVMPGGIDYTVPKVSTSPSKDAIPDAVARLEQAIAGYCTELVGYLDEMERARDCINGLEDVHHRAVLSLYYLNGFTWVAVAERLEYSPAHCKKLRNEALPLVYEVMPKEWRTMIPRAD